jgi:hypothetical protein
MLPTMNCRTLILICLGLLALRHLTAANPSPAEFFNPAIVQEIRVEIAAKDLQSLNDALPKRISVPAVFRWKDQTLANVAVRYKGNSSSARGSSHKRSFLFDFGDLQKGQRFLGLRHVALDNGIQFGSLFSERLITEILAGEGVKASRCNYARLFLNDKFIGIYVNVERIDKDFLEHHFGADKGALFKVGEGGPGGDLRFLEDNPNQYRNAFELQAGRDRESYDALVDFIRIVNAPSSTESDLRRVMDVSAFIKTTAIMLFAGAFDQYTGWNAHNYYLYQNPADKRWTYLPWDLDVGFSERAFDRIAVLDDWNAAWPAPVPDRVLMERIVSDPKLLNEYRGQAKLILEKWFKPEILIPKLRALHAQIRDDLAKDPFPARRATNPRNENYEEILASMETFIRKRYESARAQLASPGKRPAPARPHAENNPNEEPKPGPPSADAPTDLRLVSATPNKIELQWTDHAEGEVAHVVQRSDDHGDFRNAIGQMGPAITTAIDQNVEPGKTYRYRVYAVFPTPNGPRGSGLSNPITVRVPEK